MAHIMDQSGGDFQQDGCLYKQTSDIQWTPKNSWTSDKPQKQVSEKADQSTLGSSAMVISWFIDQATD